MKRVRKIVAASIVAVALTPLVASAHPGHDHGDEEAGQAETTAAVVKDKETGQETHTGIDPMLVAIGGGALTVFGAVVVGVAYVAGNKRAAKLAKKKKN